HLAAVLSFAPGDRQDTAFPDAAEHGTHVMGTIGAIAGNNEGTAGVAPEARLISVQVFYRHHDPATGEVDLGPTIGDIAEGLDKAIAQGAQVINLSLGPQYKEKYGEALQDPVRRDATVRQILAQRDRIRRFYDTVLLKVAARGVVCVVAAGNERLPANWSPLCASPLTLGVGAVGPNDHETTFSNYEDPDYQDGTGHRSVTLCAPGKDIWSTRPVWSKASYGPESGTSMAAPHVTGAVALLKSIAPSSTLTDVREVLVRTARPINMQHDIGPLLDVNAAVQEMLRRRDAGELLPPAPPDPPEDEQLFPPGFAWPPQPPLIVIQLGPQRGGWLGRLIRFLIDRFLRTARPLDGGQFDEWGRWILWPRWVTQGPPPDAAGRDRYRYIWDHRTRLATTTNGSLERWLLEQVQKAVQEAEQARGKKPPQDSGSTQPPAHVPAKTEPKPTRTMSQVPNVVNQMGAEARPALVAAGVVAKFQVGKAAPSADQAGRIYRQEPAAGTEVAEKSLVLVLVYGEPEKVMLRVPDVVGKNYAIARQAIIDAKLVPQVAKGKPAPKTAQVSEVYSQEPAAGSESSEQATVRMTIYGEPEKHTIRVPDVVGRTATEARQTIVAAKLLSQFQGGNPAPTANQAFRIYRQDPAAGTEVEERTTVRVTLYGEPAKSTVRVPDVMGRKSTDAQKAIKDAKLAPSIETVLAAPTPDKVSRVYRQNPTAGSLVEEGATVRLTVYDRPPKTAPPAPLADAQWSGHWRGKNTTKSVAPGRQDKEETQAADVRIVQQGKRLVMTSDGNGAKHTLNWIIAEGDPSRARPEGETAAQGIHEFHLQGDEIHSSYQFQASGVTISSTGVLHRVKE
ncbi:MAG: S8 family serine peptidase, partial [Planctomycetota bacterium]|nr:S8 family serine peptidase [Planctomycetota bacterium]